MLTTVDNCQRVWEKLSIISFFFHHGRLCGLVYDDTDARIDVSTLKELPGFFEKSFRSKDMNDGKASAKDAYAIGKARGCAAGYGCRR